MIDEIKKEIIYDLNKAVEILSKKDAKDLEELQQLSNHAIEDVAAHKDLDLVTVTVLMYSLYKIVQTLSEKDYDIIQRHLENARNSLEGGNLGKYNSAIRLLYETVRSCNVKVKQHLEDVMHAARIKKGAILLQKGLSIGQAAGLMGLSNWDLQVYAGKTITFEQHKEKIPVKKRMLSALKIFEVK